MSKLCVLLWVLCGCSLSAISAPAHDHEHSKLTVELSEVVGKSVCPIRVEISEDHNRIPRRIKMLKCARSPNPVCQRESMTHACCRHRHHEFTTQCAEVVDHVLVQYLDQPTPVAVPVSVGCTCMITQLTRAVVDDS